MSAMIVCPATMKYVPVKPVPISLMAVNVAILGATAVPIDVMNITARADMYAIRLENLSLKGTHIMEEIPIARSTPEFVMLMIVGVACVNSADISGLATRTEVLVQTMTRQFQLTTNRITILLHFGSPDSAVSGSAGGGVITSGSEPGESS